MSYPYTIKDSSGKDHSIDETLHHKYLENVKRIEEEFDVKLPNIKRVYIGSASEPITRICFDYGIELFADESLYPGVDEYNADQIQLYKLRRF